MSPSSYTTRFLPNQHVSFLRAVFVIHFIVDLDKSFHFPWYPDAFFSKFCSFQFIGSFPEKLVPKKIFRDRFGPEVKFSGWNTEHWSGGGAVTCTDKSGVFLSREVWVLVWKCPISKKKSQQFAFFCVLLGSINYFESVHSSMFSEKYKVCSYCKYTI